MNRRHVLGMLGGTLAMGPLSRPARAGEKKAGVRLMFAIDSSASVHDDMFALQVRGTAASLIDSGIARTVAGFPDGIDILAYAWGDVLQEAVLLPWTSVRTASDCVRAASVLAASARPFRGLATGINWALSCARQLNANAPREALRTVLDISGDGRSNMLPISMATAPQAAVVVGTLGAERNSALDEGMVINAIAIPGREAGLSEYQRQNVIGGAGSFAAEVSGEREYPAILRRKILLEIA